MFSRSRVQRFVQGEKQIARDLRFQYTKGSFKHWLMASFGKQIFTVAVFMFIQMEKTDNELKKSTHQS